MEWSKLNMDEVFYYCKSFDVDFDCGPFDYQMEQLVLMFSYYGIEQFTVKDIQEFYKELQISRPKRNDELIKPTPGKIRKTAERMKNIECTGNDVFKIIPAETGLYLPFDTAFYSDDIKKGYQEHKIYPGCFQKKSGAAGAGLSD